MEDLNMTVLSYGLSGDVSHASGFIKSFKLEDSNGIMRELEPYIRSIKFSMMDSFPHKLLPSYTLHGYADFKGRHSTREFITKLRHNAQSTYEKEWKCIGKWFSQEVRPEIVHVVAFSLCLQVAGELALLLSPYGEDAKAEQTLLTWLNKKAVEHVSCIGFNRVPLDILETLKTHIRIGHTFYDEGGRGHSTFKCCIDSMKERGIMPNDSTQDIEIPSLQSP